MSPGTLDAIERTRAGRAPVKRDGRCVNCSRPRESHAEDGDCPGSGRGKYATMDLADGKTCADCRHVERCCSIFGQLPEDESCQFFPVRFAPRVEVPL